MPEQQKGTIEWWGDLDALMKQKEEREQHLDNELRREAGVVHAATGPWYAWQDPTYKWHEEDKIFWGYDFNSDDLVSVLAGNCISQLLIGLAFGYKGETSPEEMHFAKRMGMANIEKVMGAIRGEIDKADNAALEKMKGFEEKQEKMKKRLNYLIGKGKYSQAYEEFIFDFDGNAESEPGKYLKEMAEKEEEAEEEAKLGKEWNKVKYWISTGKYDKAYEKLVLDVGIDPTGKYGGCMDLLKGLAEDKAAMKKKGGVKIWELGIDDLTRGMGGGDAAQEAPDFGPYANGGGAYAVRGANAGCADCQAMIYDAHNKIDMAAAYAVGMRRRASAIPAKSEDGWKDTF